MPTFEVVDMVNGDDGDHQGGVEVSKAATGATIDLMEDETDDNDDDEIKVVEKPTPKRSPRAAPLPRLKNQKRHREVQGVFIDANDDGDVEILERPSSGKIGNRKGMRIGKVRVTGRNQGEDDEVEVIESPLQATNDNKSRESANRNACYSNKKIPGKNRVDSSGSNDATPKSTAVASVLHHGFHSNSARNNVGGSIESDKRQSNLIANSASAAAVDRSDPNSSCKRRRLPSSPPFLKNGQVSDGAIKMTKSKRRRVMAKLKAKARKLKEKQAQLEKEAGKASDAENAVAVAMAPSSPIAAVDVVMLKSDAAMLTTDAAILAATNSGQRSPPVDTGASAMTALGIATTAVPPSKTLLHASSATTPGSFQQMDELGERTKTPSNTSSLSLFLSPSPRQSANSKNSSKLPNNDGQTVIEIADGDDDDVDEMRAVRLSRDRQYALYLNRMWRLGYEDTGHQRPPIQYDPNSSVGLPTNGKNCPDPLESPTGEPTDEIIELLDDSDGDSKLCGNGCSETQPKGGNGVSELQHAVVRKPSKTETESERRKKSDERFDGTGAASSRKMVGDSSLTKRTLKQQRRQKKKSKLENRDGKKKRRGSLSTECSTDDESASSVWTASFQNTYDTLPRPLTIKLRKPKNVISVSDINSNSGFESQCTVATTGKNNPCDFTGKEISTRKCNIQRTSSRRITDSDEPETDDSSAYPSRKISPSNSIDASVLKTEQVLQRKPPPPLTNPKKVKEKIEEISQRIHFEHKKAKKNILERALLQHKTNNRQLAASRIMAPRIRASSTKLKYIEKNESRSTSGDGHTAIVNSSLTVLSTVDDDKVKEESKRERLLKKAQNLSVMPYEFKDFQKQFAAILDALPSDQQHHPEVHQYVSQLLYTPPNSTSPKLEVPHQFKEAPTNDTRPTKMTPRLKDPDENDTDYVSIMNGFRDFCVQCKTFDCQFHITSYPDAATQACVAIQYDKRALKRQTQEAYKLNHDDPFSFLLPTADNKMVLVDNANSHRFENPTNVEIICSTESADRWVDKETTNFSGNDMLCPFCNYCCHGQEKLSKHLSRYHQDTFYCRQVGSKITTVIRTEAKETMKPEREYYHSRSLIPIQRGHFDRDSDDESDYSWYHDYRRNLVEDLTDVSEKEKKIYSMWNRFLGCSPVIIADKDVPNRCFYFIQKHAMELAELEWELYQLLITFWERHLLTVIHVEKLMHLFHVKLERKSIRQEKENPLTPRKRVIFSRLFMIFKSFGESVESKLREALRRNDVGSDNVVDTPLLPQPFWPKWTRKRTINMAMRMRAEDISRPFFFPCSHAGKCSEENGCTCIENDNLCTKHCIWGEFGDNFFPGCNCTGDCSTAKNCPCRDANRECDPDICRCSASTEGCRKSCGCKNMDVSLAKRVPLLIGRSQIKGAGLGLFTKNALKRGDYVDEYIGEFIKREYQLGRSEEYYFDHSDDYITDATHQGNKTRYLNHSLTPNIEARHRFVNGEKRIAFFAKHDIPAQTELFYSYGKSYNVIWRSKGLPHLCVDSDDDGYQEEEEEEEEEGEDEEA